ncbi:hypothetical protein F4780DRAFT_500322 [Xylariomycetidae sp. FL0641]|nr:hypothetical protein F4780DRAFT_500322 [Xylariomycetidae sp. FL0641]
MPAINLTSRPTFSDAASGFVSVGHKHVSLTTAGSLLGLTCLITILLHYSQGKYKTMSGSLFHRAYPSTSGRPKSSLSRLSRSISNTYTAMSPGQPPELSRDGNQHTPDDSAVPQHREDVAGPPKAQQPTSLHVKGRPPPSTPSNPPGVPRGAFTFQDRRMSTAASTTGALETGIGGELGSVKYPAGFGAASETTATSDHGGSHAESRPSAPSNASAGITIQPHMIPGTGSERGPSSFPPNSFPSSSPILPLAPHQSLGPNTDAHGATVPATDDKDPGLKRHTRVFGGGVCLACLANGGDHGEGGFYGDNVPEDQRR